MLALLLVSSTSWLRGRGVPLLWASESVCGPDGATSILAKGQLWLLMREMAEGWRGVKETVISHAAWCLGVDGFLRRKREHHEESWTYWGKVHRNCTTDGWTDLLIPYEDACGYTFNESLHFLGEDTPSTEAPLKLHCTRNHIHIQLFISFILKAMFIFIRDSLLFTNEEFYHCDSYPVACKIVLMFSNYSILANYSWLLVEGHFLFTLVSRSFFSLKKHIAWYILLSWGTAYIASHSFGVASPVNSCLQINLSLSLNITFVNILQVYHLLLLSAGDVLSFFMKMKGK
ncbi:hypothetical protein XENOCAPTIV_007514 [Xenoophorus captivus]|uniref:G-protein coupled receptors family 2 profile 2 domain-containing protein n=1 Tax=Xenoophorus captivus TaxID=1517983 RepID=A0ABV0SGM2_9TELE